MVTSLCGENEWLTLWESLPTWCPPTCPILIVSPHPDDETLGVGGLLAACCSQGQDVRLLAVTDGENAYSNHPSLGARRIAEQERAAACLGILPQKIVRSHLPDSGLEACEDVLAATIRLLISPETLLIAPDFEDFHPDHKVCGRVATKIAREAKIPLLSYFFWTWHTQATERLFSLPLRRFLLTEGWRKAKSRALAEHHSQLVWKGEPPILPETLLWPARQTAEIFLPSYP